MSSICDNIEKNEANRCALLDRMDELKLDADYISQLSAWHATDEFQYNGVIGHEPALGQYPKLDVYASMEKKLDSSLDQWSFLDEEREVCAALSASAGQHQHYHCCSSQRSDNAASTVGAGAGAATRSREQLLVELSYRMERVAFLTADVDRCIDIPTATLLFCKSQLKKAVIEKNTDIQSLRALRRDVKRSELSLAKARSHDVPLAVEALASNAARIAAIKVLLE